MQKARTLPLEGTSFICCFNRDSLPVDVIEDDSENRIHATPYVLPEDVACEDMNPEMILENRENTTPAIDENIEKEPDNILVNGLTLQKFLMSNDELDDPPIIVGGLTLDEYLKLFDDKIKKTVRREYIPEKTISGTRQILPETKENFFYSRKSERRCRKSHPAQKPFYKTRQGETIRNFQPDQEK